MHKTSPRHPAQRFLKAKGRPSFPAWLALGYTVLFGAVIGFGLRFWLIGRCSLARVAPFALLQTVFAIGTGIIFLHERVSVPLLAGASVCIGGVALTQVGANADKATAARTVCSKAGQNE
ncbi:MAG: DMT family transporter [Deltaproteobacteria bacterium]|nr:DMT family transporter [Deltaproteobacteria bacterium]